MSQQTPADSDLPPSEGADPAPVTRGQSRPPRTAPATPRTPLVILGTFAIVSLTLGWVLGLPFVLMSPIDRQEFPLGLVYNLIIFTPALAAVIAYLLERRQPASVLYGHVAQTPGETRKLRPQSLTDALGITPLRPVKRLLGWSVLALLLFFGLSMVALPLGAALGVYPFDSSLPVFVQALEYRLGQDPTEFIATGLLVEVALIFALAVISVFLHAGQEMGWRGYLFPRLQLRWGTVSAVLISGVLAGLLLRHSSGEGNHQEIALSDAAVAMALPNRHGLTRQSSSLGGASAFYGVYAAAEGHVAVGALEQHFAQALTQQLNIDPDADIRGQLQRALAACTAAQWQAWGEEHGHPLTALTCLEQPST